MATQLNHLPDDCLLEVLDRLSPGQLLKIRQANHRINQLALNKIKAIKIKGSEKYPSDCSHFPISSDQVLFLDPTPKSLDLLPWESEILDIEVFSSLMTKCPGVKSIDFGRFQLMDYVDFNKLVNLLPQLECVKLSEPGFCHQNDLKQIKHFVCRCDYSSTNDHIWMLKIIASNCVNIKQLDLILKSDLTSDLAEALGMLPKSCWIKVVCDHFDDPLQDVVDELVLNDDLKFSALGHRYERLSSLKFKRRRLENAVFDGAIFAGLKKLDLSETDCWFYDRETIDCLATCRFPRLEEVCFNACYCFSFPWFDPVIRSIKSTKKLTFYFEMFIPWYLHDSVINNMKKLETLVLNIAKIRADFNKDDWHLNKFFNQLEQYVDGIKTLKKLVVEAKSDLSEEWELKLIDKVEQMNLKQQRVEIILI